MTGMITVMRGYRYRIYPTLEQEERLFEWERALRALWNVANRQRVDVHSKWRRGDRRFVGYLDQQPQLTELRQDIEWLHDAPCCACQGVLRELDKAWQRYFSGLGGKPRFKRRRDSIGMVDPAFTSKRLVEGAVKFPKIGIVRAVLHRPLEGVPSTCTVTRRGARWYASITTKIEIPDVGRSAWGVVGIDRGITSIIADSDGRMVSPPDRLVRMAQLVDAAKSKRDRKVKGSNNWREANRRVVRRQSREADIRREFLHEESRYYVENYGVVVVEALKVWSMTKSARGTLEEPGKNVGAKAGLNRSILRSGWAQFVGMLCYKAEETGAIIVQVPPAYSSQTCAECGFTAADSREGKCFACEGCGHEDDADVNAARVLVQRYQVGKGEVIGGYDSRPEAKKRLRIVKREKKTSAVTPTVNALSRQGREPMGAEPTPRARRRLVQYEPKGRVPHAHAGDT